MNKELEGILVFHSETGIEGGYWAFQDKQFIGIPDDTENCSKCGYMRAYIEKQMPEAPVQVVSLQPLGAALKGLFQEACNPGEHAWKLVNPNGAWSYEGLHIIKNGDQLTIFDKSKNEEIIWSGVINLRPFGVFTQDVFGLWIHEDQIGIDRETWAKWFFEEYSAKLKIKERR